MEQREFVLLRFFSLIFISFLLSFIVIVLSQRSMLFIEYLESFVSMYVNSYCFHTFSEHLCFFLLSLRYRLVSFTEYFIK